MSVSTIECVYCGTPNRVTQRRSSNRGIIKKMIYPPARETTSSFPIDCICEKQYSLTLIGDKNYYKQNIIPTDLALKIVKKELDNNTITHDTIIDSMTGISEFNNGTTHVCVRINEIRGYFDCVRAKGIITLTTFWRTC